MTLREIHDRLRLSTRSGRAELGAAGITERTFRRWLAGASPLFAAEVMLRLAARVTEPGEPVMVEAEIEGARLVVLREEDYRARSAPAQPGPHSPTRQLLLACSRRRMGTHSQS